MKYGAEVRDAGEILMRRISEERTNLPVIICFSVRYIIKEAYCCIKYSEFSNREQELLKVIRKRQKEICMAQQNV